MSTTQTATTQQNADWAALALRLALGTMFLAHGLLKVFIFTPAGTAGYFESLGLPGVLAWPIIIAESVAGIFLIAGVFTRIIAISMLPILFGALTLAHWGAGWVFSNQGGGWEYPAFLIAASVAAATLGNGRFAIKVPPVFSAFNA